MTKSKPKAQSIGQFRTTAAHEGMSLYGKAGGWSTQCHVPPRSVMTLAKKARALQVPTFLRAAKGPMDLGRAAVIDVRQRILSQAEQAESARTRELEQRVTALEQRIESLMPRVVILREISHEEAKDEVLNAFKTRGGPAYPSDIAEELRLDAEMVWRISEELREEGLIGD